MSEDNKIPTVADQVAGNYQNCRPKFSVPMGNSMREVEEKAKVTKPTINPDKKSLARHVARSYEKMRDKGMGF